MPTEGNQGKRRAWGQGSPGNRRGHIPRPWGRPGSGKRSRSGRGRRGLVQPASGRGSDGRARASGMLRPPGRSSAPETSGRESGVSSLPAAGAAPPSGQGTARSFRLQAHAAARPLARRPAVSRLPKKTSWNFEALGSQGTGFPWGWLLEQGWLRACGIREPPCLPHGSRVSPCLSGPRPAVGGWKVVSGPGCRAQQGWQRGGSHPRRLPPRAADASPDSRKPGDTPSAPVTRLYVRGCPPPLLSPCLDIPHPRGQCPVACNSGPGFCWGRRSVLLLLPFGSS